MTDFSKLLNPEQLEAATAGEGPILVLAAAGTGKTRTLVHRVAYLVEKGVDPSRILLLTFTNRAAKEMLERAERLVDGIAGSIWSGTFHSICARFLRRWGNAIGYQRSFTIIDEEDQRKILGEIIKAEIKNTKDFPKREVVAKMISEAANEMVPVEKIAQRSLSRTAGYRVEEIVRIAEKYVERKKALNAMDFDDLLVNGLKLISENERIRAMIQDHFLYVLVDEYQDTNSLQALFTDYIAGKHRNIMAVGDDFQCIYTWRGAKLENIMEFPSRWPGCRTIKLERNYRSTPQVLALANTVMKDAPNQFEKTLRPTRPGDTAPKPCLYSVHNAKSQANEIVAKIREAVSLGFNYGDIAVIYRSHYHSIDIEKTIHLENIPYRLTSGTGFFEKEHVKDVLAYLRLIVNPRDELSFMRFIQLLPGVGISSAKKMFEKLGGSFAPGEAPDRAKLAALLGAKTKTVWPGLEACFARTTEHMYSCENGLLVTDFIDSFYKKYIEDHWESSDAEERLAEAMELANDLADEEMGSLENYLENAALMTNLDLKKNAGNNNSVTLSTIHQAKGMEWPVVIIPWLSDTMFPNPKAFEDGREDEERRLFYVAVTRAKDMLVLYSPRNRRTPEGTEYHVSKSVFVNAIPPELIAQAFIKAPQSAYSSPYRTNSFGGGYGGRRGYGGGSSGYKTTWRK